MKWISTEYLNDIVATKLFFGNSTKSLNISKSILFSSQEMTNDDTTSRHE